MATYYLLGKYLHTAVPLHTLVVVVVRKKYIHDTVPTSRYLLTIISSAVQYEDLKVLTYLHDDAAVCRTGEYSGSSIYVLRAIAEGRTVHC